MAEVLLGLWGVLTDVAGMAIQKYGRVPEALAARHGGSLEAWKRAHMPAINWIATCLEQEGRRPSGSYSKAIGTARGGFVLRMFKGAGVPPPADPEAVGRALEYEVMSGIDAGYTDAHDAIALLRRADHRVYVAAEDSDEASRGALTGARFVGEVDGVFTEDGQDAEAKCPEYWSRIAPRLQSAPGLAFVVSGTPETLEAAASVGFRCILVDRDRQLRGRAPRSAEASLRGLADLPQVIERAVTGGSARA